VSIGVIWLVVLINLRGVREAGLFQSITTFTKLIPFFAIATLGLLWVRPHNLAAFNPSGKPLFEASAAVAPLIMFAYLGLESATVPAGDVRDAQRTIPRATLLGISAAALLYVLGTVTVMGVIPREQLAHSSSPFADASSAMWGHWAGGLIAVGALISSLGALNGWTLLMGQVPMAAAQDGLLPIWFGRRSERGVPAIAILISASLATALLLVEASREWFRGFLQLHCEPGHDGSGNTLCLLRVGWGNASTYGRRAYRRDKVTIQARRDCRLCLRHLDHLWLWRGGRVVWASPPAAGYPALRMDAKSRGRTASTDCSTGSARWN